MVYILDLKRSKEVKPLRNVDDVPPLSKMVTLNLMEEQLPLFAGLCNLGSDAYMIGGLEFPPDVTYPRAYSIYLKETSCVTFRLSLAHDATLTPSKENIKELISPKFWPIVEEIDGQIHVFDSTHENVVHGALDWIFSHEILDLKGEDRSWRKIPITGSLVKDFVRSHLVIGNRIYAVQYGTFLVFDSETKRWESGGEKFRFKRNPTLAPHVWYILYDGYARCVGEYSPIISSCRQDNKLYVVIAIVQPRPGFYEDEDEDDPYGLAYLVTSTGNAVEVQLLPQLFEGPIKPSYMVSGTVIKVDKEGKTNVCHCQGGCRGCRR